MSSVEARREAGLLTLHVVEVYSSLSKITTIFCANATRLSNNRRLLGAFQLFDLAISLRHQYCISLTQLQKFVQPNQWHYHECVCCRDGGKDGRGARTYVANKGKHDLSDVSINHPRSPPRTCSM